MPFRFSVTFDDSALRSQISGLTTTLRGRVLRASLTAMARVVRKARGGATPGSRTTAGICAGPSR